MFNEILTGKSTLEPEPVPQSPYRIESVPQISLTCTDCAQTYKAPAGTEAGRCGPCQIAFISRNQAASNARLIESLIAIESRRRRAYWGRRALFLLAGLALAFCKIEFRKSMEEPSHETSYEPAAPSGAYLEKSRGFASEMCACPDAACASAVSAKFTYWQRMTDTPSDSAEFDAAREQADRLDGCYDITRRKR